MTINEILQKYPEVEELFTNPSRKNNEELLEKLKCLDCGHYTKSKSKITQQNKDDIKQEFFISICQNKFRWTPEKHVSLAAYLIGTIRKKWADYFRFERKHTYHKENIDYIDDIDAGTQENFVIPQENIPRVQQYIEKQKNPKRLILKMWIPYIFEYNFAEDEYDLLTRYQVDIKELKEQLEQMQQKKPYVPYSFIANILQQKEDTIGAIIRSTKRHLRTFIDFPIQGGSELCN